METKTEINNKLYNSLGDDWYKAYDHPVALLRQEAKIKFSWINERIKQAKIQNLPLQILDVGCGGGFLSNRLAQEKYAVTGIDLSEESLEVARKHDQTHQVQYINADAYKLPFKSASFDVVTAMDFLEHVELPEKVVEEISRVLKPGGIFFFHTFNRNWLSHLVIIKLVELLVKNTPQNLHVIDLFIKPEELTQFCRNNEMNIAEMTGIRPCFSTITLRGLLNRTVPENFAFTLTPSLKLSYLGYAIKDSVNHDIIHQ